MDVYAGQDLTPEDILGLVLPPSVTDRQDAAVDGITGSGWAAGGTVCGRAFTAPPSGQVWVDWAAQVSHDTAGRETLVSIEVRHGEDVGDGQVHFGASDNISLAAPGGIGRIRYGVGHLVDGLIPGNPYNVRTMHRVTSGGGTGRVARRQVTVTASW